MVGRARLLLASVIAASALACSALMETDGLSGGKSDDAGSSRDAATSTPGIDVDAARSGDATPLVDSSSEADAGSDAASSDASPPRTTCSPGAPSLVLAPRRGAAAANVIGSGQGAWANPSRALTLDGLSASVDLGSPASSDELLVTQFGFALPSSAVALTGLEVVVTRWSVDGQVKDGKVRFYRGGFPTGVDHAFTSFWPTSSGTKIYGSASDTWGINLADVTAADFGVVVSARLPSGLDTAHIDDVYVVVHYCE